MLLRPDSSAGLRHSRAREVTGAFTATWTARGPDYTVVHRDLVKDLVPHVTDAALHWAEDLRTQEERPDLAAEAVQRELLEELVSADVLAAELAANLG